ncbi:MAG: TonB-dependent receptor [Gammaproteobacteria bacterium]|nr:TonB-dependent receptor [Gammaproteobacteria bacterium]
MMLKKQGLLIIATATTVLGTQSSFAKSDNPATQIELPSLSVINTTPLPGIGLPLAKYPGNVQVISSETLEQQESTDLSEALFKNIGSVDINSAQNNPFQNDLHYRGFLSSPLVGSAIGISTYIDGVRVNEGFGDTVNWDLIPEFAIASIAVIPGSNPLFGLNTLGGALSIQTKNGFNFSGTQVELLAGSDARRSGTIEHGGSSGNVDWYIGANKFREDGWRQRSPSDVKQLFAKVGWETDTSDLDLSYTYANNDLIGNGFVPESHLTVDRNAVYTFPDQTENKMNFFNLRGSHWLAETTLLAANAFYRNYQRSTLNGDAEVLCVDPGDNPVLDGNGNPLHPALCTGVNVLEAEGEDRTTQTETDNWGGTFQISHDSELFGKNNSFVIGSAYDKAETDFKVALTESTLFNDGLSRGTGC